MRSFQGLSSILLDSIATIRLENNKKNNPNFPNSLLIELSDPLQFMAYEYLITKKMPVKQVQEWFNTQDAMIMKIYNEKLKQ